LALLCPLLSACGTLHDRPLPNGRGWGEDATLSPGLDRLRWAAGRAARDPGTWAPGLAALGIAVTGTDRRISDWAREERPLFGSRDPDTISDNLRNVTDLMMFTTALMTPSGPPDEFVENKGRGVGVEALAVVTTITVTNTLKYTVHREQPSGGHESFVSNHATEPFAHAALIRRNTALLDLSPEAARAIDGSAYVMATGSAWARVEMGLHYPSDQLAGAAIGNFIALFVHDAFLGLDPSTPAVGLTPIPAPALVVQWRW
jgi:hypothetical protein